MKIAVLLLTTLLTSQAFAERIQEIDCKVEFNMSVLKRGLIGKFKKKSDMAIRVDPMDAGIPVNKDGSAFTTSASHTDDNNRLSTHFKTKMNSQKGVKVSLNFMAQGSDLIPKIHFILGPNDDAETVLEKAETIKLVEAVEWKREGRNKLKIESVTYDCRVTKMQ